jgi:hypothetical protein
MLLLLTEIEDAPLSAADASAVGPLDVPRVAVNLAENL